MPWWTIALLGFVLLGALVWWYRSTRRPMRAPAVVGPPRYRFCGIDGFRIRYLDQGKGPPLLLLHGLGASLFTWRHQWPELSQKFRVICVDLPGFGASDKWPDKDYDLEAQVTRLIAFCDHLRLGRVGLIGSSMGGAIALAMTSRDPDRFPRVATMSPATHKKLVFFNPQFLQQAAKPLVGLLHRRIQVSIMKRVLFQHDQITDEILNAYFQPFRDQPQALQTFIKAVQVISKPDWPSILRLVRAPHLLLYGKHDRMVPLKYMHGLVELIPHTQLLTHDEGGHHLMEDQPEWVNTQLVNFFSPLQKSPD